MPFQFFCPQGHVLNGDESQVGQPCQCPYCGSSFVIPQASGAPQGPMQWPGQGGGGFGQPGFPAAGAMPGMASMPGMQPMAGGPFQMGMPGAGQPGAMPMGMMPMPGTGFETQPPQSFGAGQPGAPAAASPPAAKAKDSEGSGLILPFDPAEKDPLPFDLPGSEPAATKPAETPAKPAPEMPAAGPMMGNPMMPGMNPMMPGAGPMMPGMNPMMPGMGPMTPGMGQMMPGMGQMGQMMPGMGQMMPGAGPMMPGMPGMAQGMPMDPFAAGQAPMQFPGVGLPTPEGAAPQSSEPASAPAAPTVPTSATSGREKPAMADITQDEARKIHVNCPAGHTLKVSGDLNGKTVRCPVCKETFKVRFEDSVEFGRRKAKMQQQKEAKAGQVWLAWAILAAVGVLVGLIVLMFVFSG